MFCKKAAAASVQAQKSPALEEPLPPKSAAPKVGIFSSSSPSFSSFLPQLLFNAQGELNVHATKNAPRAIHGYNFFIVDNILEELGITDITHEQLWAALQGLPYVPIDEELQLTEDKNGPEPRVLPGQHPALYYRGNPLPRDKVFFQTNYAGGYAQYGYTGFQHQLGAVQTDVKKIPVFDRLQQALAERTPDVVPAERRFNHGIGTIYRNGEYNIKPHSDKMEDWVPNTPFLVIKLGAPRRFVITTAEKPVEVLFDGVLPPGAGIIMGADTNAITLHSVPEDPNVTEASGSLVFRCVDKVVPWEEKKKMMAKSEEDKIKRRKTSKSAAPKTSKSTAGKRRNTKGGKRGTTKLFPMPTVIVS